MEYISKIKISEDKKVIIFNEEAVQSLNLDGEGSKVIIIITLKDETEKNKDNRESSIYLANIKNSTIENNLETLSDYIKKESLREVIMQDDGTAYINIDENVISYFNKLFKDTKEFKILYQENVSGELKMFREFYDISEIFHKVSKLTTKRNIIGKDDEISVEKRIKVNN